MSDLRKAAEMALKYFEDAHGLEDEEVAIKEALRQALAQPEQEPVAAHQALEALDELESCARGDEPFNHFAAPLVRQFIEQAVVLPKKEWVGLTDEEIWDLGADHAIDLAWAREIEAKLKEKNV